MPPNLGGFFMVRSYYPSECHADYFDFERIEALKPAIEACGISTLSQSPMLGFHKQMDNRIKLLEEILSFRMQGVEFDNEIGRAVQQECRDLSTLYPYTPLFRSVRSYYPSECHADYFDFERIEALKPAIEACGISTLSQSPMLGFHKQMDNRIKLLEEILSFRMQGVEFDNGDMYVDG